MTALRWYRRPHTLVVPVSASAPSSEQVSGSSGRRSASIVGAHLDEVATRGDTGLGKVASQRLGHLGGIDGAVASWFGTLAVRFL